LWLRRLSIGSWSVEEGRLSHMWTARCPEEEGGYEYISDHHSGQGGKEEPHVESAVLVQPLQAEAGEGGGDGEPEGFRIPVAGGCPSTKDPCYKHIRHHSGSADEGGCPRGSRGKSCGSRGGGSVAWETLEEALSIGECLYQDMGACPTYGAPPSGTIRR
jgi:hypothetical protein